MKIKVVKNLYLICKPDGSLELKYGNEHLHTPKAEERDREIEQFLESPNVDEVFYLKHVASAKEVDESIFGGLI